MLIVLDYDETYTACPPLWDAFIDLCKQYGAEVVCCTLRVQGKQYGNEDVESDMGRHGIQVVYAGLCQDKWEAMELSGFVPENAIWIDDMPGFVWMRDLKDHPGLV